MSNIIAAFSIEQAARLAELTVARLTDWDRTSFFPPSLAYEDRASPQSRIYTFDDLVGLRALSMLRKSVSMQHLRKAAIKLKRYSGRPWSELTLDVLNREVHFKNPKSGDVEGAVSGQLAIPIALGDVAASVAKGARELRKRESNAVGQIEKHKKILGGVPCVAGTRIPVATVQRMAEKGQTVAEICHAFPILQADDVKAALQFDGQLTQAA
ncbi:DUF433 domain-containing protein [Sandarakinorhabdus limnophila]|uniref:DUF433 domain-containing protein n=1 Tax=Sandarakinorhabdus limnophila TaxID=210512 RepID=UPI0026F1078E|nr:DUF433 domain-containing protein [Sandarakinorhabdus limnophila]